MSSRELLFAFSSFKNRIKCKGMLKHSLYFSLNLFLLLTGCYSRHQLTSLSPTNGQVEKEIEILTKQDSVVRLVSYEITFEKIIGKNRDGEHYEEHLENIKTLTSPRKLDTERTIISSALVLGIAFFLYYYFSIQGFSQLH